MQVFGFVDEKQIKKEREKARELRKSGWWKRQLGQGLCYYCQESFPREGLSMDHKMPIARGGRSTKGNVVVSCKACNTKKSHLTLAEMTMNSQSAQFLSTEPTLPE